MNKEIISFAISATEARDITTFYQSYQRLNRGDYIVFQAAYQRVIITIYENKKHEHKVTFIGYGALSEARKWNKEAQLVKAKAPPEKGGWRCFADQIGSDEVGVGDFLLPMIVVAAFVRGKDIPILEKYGVKDSKRLTDAKIREITPPLLKIFKVSKLTISNERYNEVIASGENLNSIKAKMHNRALLNLFKQFPDTKNIFVDQFVGESKYFSYLNDPNEQKVINITFKTKGESYYPCVALASVVARYAFLLEKDKLDKRYKLSFPYGAGKQADTFAKRFINKYGSEQFKKIAKQNFANYQRTLEDD
ncbi:MAG: ribonuclease HIII [Erysipelotrichia bacterium]|nr:ribonuclease HIII [Erysipelotrichia bacterium]